MKTGPKRRSRDRVRIYGCGDCGSEYTANEARATKRMCLMCMSEAPLEYIGDWRLDSLYKVDRCALFTPDEPEDEFYG